MPKLANDQIVAEDAIPDESSPRQLGQQQIAQRDGSATLSRICMNTCILKHTQSMLPSR
jgi:hypothetical protein